MGDRCHPVSHTRPARPMHLTAPGPAEESGEDDSKDEEEAGDDDVQRRKGINLNLLIQNLVRQNARRQFVSYNVVSICSITRNHN